ncbi:protein of unknown function [Xenorhabdus poinarii G6]|uniref:Uncharacterized protein n=1 Tax=Xenorhabdus poinarii G6 TaxID=1354304 RepID=A0A068R4U3_9GAMM|nr:protein of unknown function [Xenorhabdus poinarii G6]
MYSLNGTGKTGANEKRFYNDMSRKANFEYSRNIPYASKYEILLK